ncbi:MAG TPA: von Willebrand factor type A domain-containing protein [Chitinophagales bacterium]|nr:von Willebrand factor type A domain-containing protein [Chitinophagales bacterium]
MKAITKTHYTLILMALLSALLAFRKADNCSISGKITDEIGDGIAVANVVLEQNGTTVGGTTTDFDGNYCIAKLAAGSYNIKVTYVGYKTAVSNNVAVVENKTTTINIRLKPSTADLKEVAIMSYKVPLRGAYTGKAKAFANTAIGHTYDWAPAPSPPRYDLGETEKPKSKKTEEGSNTEEYDRIIENEFLRPTEKALSTFSIDVDVASYSMMRRKVEEGQRPPQGSVRLEEMINYFTYNYANPTDGKPFSVATEVGECAWNTNHRIMQIGIQGLRIDKSVLPPANLVFLIDVSGSMSSYDKLPLVKQSLQMLTNELRPQDRIAMVVYAGSSGLVLPSTPCSSKQKILDALDRLEAGGSTAGVAGINQAYEVAKANFIANGNNRVILCTDGDFNVGVSSDAELTTLIEKKREEGVFLSVLGFGMGNYKDSKMEKLADKGNGNYAYIDNLAEAKKNLVTQMGGTLLTIAKDVKIQVEFNPAKVKAYRLIGYENRVLADKDFNDDKKDAGEIGAGTSVTALYEIITDENDPAFKDMPKTDKLKYQKTEPASTTTGGDEMATIKIRYKEPKENTSQLLEYAVKNENVALPQTSENYRFASAVAAFGMLLRDSKFSGNYTYDKVRELAISAKGTDAEGYRAEFIKLVTAAKKLPKAAQP